MNDQAMKLFEVLSGVDEELLERCNQKMNRKHAAVYRLLGKYSRAMAACVCLIVVGAAAWSGYRFAAAHHRADASGSDRSPAELYNMAQSIQTEDGGSSAGNDVTGAEDKMSGYSTAAAGGTAGEEVGLGLGEDGSHMEAASSAAAAEAETPEVASSQDQSVQNQTSADKANEMSSSGNGLDPPAENSISEKMAELLQKENEIQDSREMVLWEEAAALEPFAGYVPTALPAGYVPFSARRSGMPDLWNNVVFKWSDGEHIFSLNMTLGEATTREDIEKRDGVNEYLAEEFRKELIPEPMDGRILFTLYFADGMRIDFDGYLTVDEMWKVVEVVSN